MTLYDNLVNTFPDSKIWVHLCGEPKIFISYQEKKENRSFRFMIGSKSRDGKYPIRYIETAVVDRKNHDTYCNKIHSIENKIACVIDEYVKNSGEQL